MLMDHSFDFEFYFLGLFVYYYPLGTYAVISIFCLHRRGTFLIFVYCGTERSISKRIIEVFIRPEFLPRVHPGKVQFLAL